MSPLSVLQDEVPTVPGSSELSDARSARALGSEITQAGVAVYDALQHERELQDARHRYAIVVNLLLVPCSTVNARGMSAPINSMSP